MAETMKYFSTKFTVKILGARYIPSVCYKLDETLEPTIRKLVETGDARMYADKVRFVNGNPISVAKKVQEKPDGAGEVVGKVSSVRPAKSGRTGKRDFD